MNLSEATERLVENSLRTMLSPIASTGLIGVSCLAKGADSIFARMVIELDGKLEVIIPAYNYRDTKVDESHAAEFDRLVDAASLVLTMPHEESNREAYEAANTELLSRSDQLFAVWDGRAQVDQGGTAAVVSAAESINLPVHVIWPPGARRHP